MDGFVADTVVFTPHADYSKAPYMTRALIHQRFGHILDDTIDIMCRKQILDGFPLVQPSRYNYDCPIYSPGKLPQFKKGKTICTKAMAPGECLHMDFTFWDIISRRNFTTVLTIVDAASRMIWLFFTASKKPPLHILRWFFANQCQENRKLADIRGNKDGALVRSYAFTTFLRDEEQPNLETTGGYESFLNGKVECPNRTLAERTRFILLNAGAPPMDWCYAIE
jgi:hypothetical protein